MPFYLTTAYTQQNNKPITLSISFSFNLYLLRDSQIIKASAIDDSLDISLKAYKGKTSVLFLKFFSTDLIELHFSDEETCKEVHDLLSEIKQKQHKVLEANLLDLTLEKTKVYKYNSRSCRKVLKYLVISHDIEEIQWSNSIDSIKYSSSNLLSSYQYKMYYYS